MPHFTPISQRRARAGDVSAQPILTDPSIFRPGSNANDSLGKLVLAGAALGLKIAVKDQERAAIHQISNATESFENSVGSILKNEDFSPTARTDAVVKSLRSISETIEDQDVRDRFTIKAAHILNRANKNIEVEVEQLKVVEASRLIRGLNGATVEDNFISDVKSLGFNPVQEEKLITEGQIRLRDLKGDALGALLGATNSQGQIDDIFKRLDGLNHVGLTDNELRFKFAESAARAAAIRPSVLTDNGESKLDAILGHLGTMDPAFQAALKRTENAESVVTKGAQVVAGIFAGTSDTQMPQSEAVHNKFIERAQQAGATLPSIASMYAANPTAPLTKHFKDVIKNAPMPERILSLKILQGRDRFGREARLIAEEMDESTQAIFSATKHLDVTDSRYTNRVNISEADGFAEGIGFFLETKNASGTAVGQKVPPLTYQGVAAALGVRNEDVSPTVFNRFQDIFGYALGETNTRSDLATQDLNSVALNRAAQILLNEGILPQSIKLGTGLSFNPASPRATVSEELEVNSEALRVKLETEVNEALVETSQRIRPTFGRMVGLLGAPLRLEPVVAQPVPFDGKLHIPIFSTPTVFEGPANEASAYIRWNLVGASEVFFPNSSEFQNIDAIRLGLPTDVQANAFHSLAWQDGYGSKFVNDIDGIKNGPIRRGIDSIVNERYIESTSKTQVVSETDLQEYNRLRLETLISLGWDGFESQSGLRR